MQQLQEDRDKVEALRATLEEELRQLQQQDSAVPSGPVQVTKSVIQGDMELHKQELDTERAENTARVSALRVELEEERGRLKQFVKETAMQHRQHMDQVKQLNAQLEEKDEQLTLLSNNQPQPGQSQVDFDRLSEEVLALRDELASTPQMPNDIAEYEQQLNDFRDQLETAQDELARKEEQVNETIKQTELTLSRERAEIHRERANIERTRLELKAELQHAAREAEIREQMAPVRELQHELKSQDRPVEDTSLTGKIRGFLRRLGE